MTVKELKEILDTIPDYQENIDININVATEFEDNEVLLTVLKLHLNRVVLFADDLYDYIVKEECCHDIPREDIPDYVRIFDNDEARADRYTVVIGNGVYSMCESPFHPQGICQYCNELNKMPDDLSHLGKEICFSALNEDVQQAIKDRC
jgi:hypothetical protein